MMQTSIFVDTDSMKVHPSRAPTANIWVTIDGRDFPAPRWNDFVVTILGWWAAASLRLLRNISAREKVHFMDGPYAVEMVKTSSGTLQLRALEGSDRIHEVAIEEVSMMSFIDELICKSWNVVCECKRRDWWSNDVQTLERSLRTLRQLMKLQC